MEEASEDDAGAMAGFTLEQLREALGGDGDEMELLSHAMELPMPPAHVHARGGGTPAALRAAKPTEGPTAFAPRAPADRGSPLIGKTALASAGVVDAAASLSLDEFVRLISRTGFDHAIERMARTAKWGVTVFAPVSVALSAALSARPLSNDALREVLRAHVSTGVLTAAQLGGMGLVQTDAGQCHVVRAGGAGGARSSGVFCEPFEDVKVGSAGGEVGGLWVAGVRVLVADIPICGGNGVLHVVEAVLPTLRLTQPPRREQGIRT
ncbi:hypothetical protein T492DRAFT_883349 [Pavlovales sp. CCMP2436]|nr:hypothetical protein T492DRAFT_883349 [Pavlovales sp. CCMP2436]